MTIKSASQLTNTRQKLELVETQIAVAKSRSASPENDESIQALTAVANQLREEIVRFTGQQKRLAS